MNSRLGLIWISSEPPKWADDSIERTIKMLLPINPINFSSPLYTGMKYSRMSGGGPARYAVLGAMYHPNDTSVLKIEVAVIKVINPVNKPAEEYEQETNERTSAWVFAKATTVLQDSSVLNSGTLHLDPFRTHNDNPQKLWKWATRIVIGLLCLTSYGDLSDEAIVTKLEAFAGSSY